MLSNVYGKSISNADANRHFNLVMKIRERWQDDLKILLAKDPEALRYYCGLGDNIESDLCFIFDKHTIQGLRDKLDKGLADGLVIFNGVREKKDSPKEGEEGEYSDTDGRPTLMIFPYKMATPESPKSKFKLVIMNGDNEGYEHPGTGGKPPGGKLKNEEGKYEVPGNFESIEIHKFL